VWGLLLIASAPNTIAPVVNLRNIHIQ
jgi:hypothetical protein